MIYDYRCYHDKMVSVVFYIVVKNYVERGDAIMTKGRMEQDSKIESKILDKLAFMPDCISNYYYSLTAMKKEATTKHVYIDHVLNFLTYYAEAINKPVRKIDMNDIQKINTSTIDRYIIIRRENNGNPIKDQSMCVILAALGSFFKFLVSHDYIEKDPMNGKIEKPRITEDNPVVYMTVDEIQTVLENIRTGSTGNKNKIVTKDWVERDMLLFLIPIYTGIRNSALCNINVEDICFEKNSFIGTDKRNKTSVYYFDDQIKELMLKYMKVREKKLNGSACSAFFIGKHLGRISPKSVGKIVAKYTFNIDKHITPHKLRSTCATTMYAQTHDIYLVSKVLGHSSPTTTRKYTEMTESRRTEAADIMGRLIQIV